MLGHNPLVHKSYLVVLFCFVLLIISSKCVWFGGCKLGQKLDSSKNIYIISIKKVQTFINMYHKEHSVTRWSCLHVTVRLTDVYGNLGGHDELTYPKGLCMRAGWSCWTPKAKPSNKTYHILYLCMVRHALLLHIKCNHNFHLEKITILLSPYNYKHYIQKYYIFYKHIYIFKSSFYWCYHYKHIL